MNTDDKDGSLSISTICSKGEAEDSNKWEWIKVVMTAIFFNKKLNLTMGVELFVAHIANKLDLY